MKSVFMRKCVACIKAVYSQLEEQLWKDLPIINEVEREAAFLGTMTALFHQTLMIQVLWHAISEARDGKLSDDYDGRDSFLELASDCWDDFNS